jgi:hypothetical protein
LDAPVSTRAIVMAESDLSVVWMASRIEERTFGSAPSREGKYQIEMRLEDTALKQARYLWRRILTPAADEWVTGDVGIMSHFRRPASLVGFLVKRRLKRSAKTADT